MLLQAQQTETFEQIFRIEEGDVLIGISFPRYSNKTVKAMEYAYNKELRLLLLRMVNVFSHGKKCNCRLIARSDMVSFVVL